MRLASVNLLHGRSLSDGQVVPSRLADAARLIDADVVGLQEVDRGQDRSGGADQTAAFAASAGAAHWRFAPALWGTPGASWRAALDGEDLAEPGYGIGLVSRRPVQRWVTVRLPAAPVRSPVLIPGTRRPVWLADEPRLGLAAVVDGPHGPLTVATTHLSFVPGWNLRQLRRLLRALSSLPQPVVLLGDLNVPGATHRVVSHGWRPLARVATYPSVRPRV
ncbi:MAG TPA: endonuclease/exonuclease/phosphatase family protein [Mycobacteriales bacterium]|nr:endonuclease/exonuclease/phosphatase family protein [Mycobacteriales bacterium]